MKPNDAASASVPVLTSVPGLQAAVELLAPYCSAPPAPAVLHQFWDRDPPRQVAWLLRHNAKLCRKWGMAHELWDQRRAEAFLAESAPEHLPLFRAAPHPAMASDLLRLIILERYGGIWLDADMGLHATGGARLAHLLHEALLFKWTHPDRSNLPNWCFGFRAGHPMLQALITQTASAMDQALATNPQEALRNILDVSGPGRFTRIVAGWIDAHGCPPGLLMLDVAEAYRMVQNGPDLLKAPLDYKKTNRHWLIASRSPS